MVTLRMGTIKVSDTPQEEPEITKETHTLVSYGHVTLGLFKVPRIRVRHNLTNKISYIDQNTFDKHFV